MAHSIVAALVCSREVRLVHLGRKPRWLLELHPFLKILNKKIPVRCGDFMS